LILDLTIFSWCKVPLSRDAQPIRNAAKNSKFEEAMKNMVQRYKL
jgi:hypothetical protein